MVKKIILYLVSMFLIGCATRQTYSDLDFHWVRVKSGETPLHAIIAAYDKGKPTNICRAKYLSGTHPGQLIENGCLISYGVKVFVQKDYEVLVGDQANVEWGTLPLEYSYPDHSYPYCNNFVIPILGGYEPDKKRYLYVCRAMYLNNIYVGKMVDGKCNLGFDGEQSRVSVFEVLFRKR